MNPENNLSLAGTSVPVGSQLSNRQMIGSFITRRQVEALSDSLYRRPVRGDVSTNLAYQLTCPSPTVVSCSIDASRPSLLRLVILLIYDMLSRFDRAGP